MYRYSSLIIRWLDVAFDVGCSCGLAFLMLILAIHHQFECFLAFSIHWDPALAFDTVLALTLKKEYLSGWCVEWWKSSIATCVRVGSLDGPERWKCISRWSTISNFRSISIIKVYEDEMKKKSENLYALVDEEWNEDFLVYRCDEYEVSENLRTVYCRLLYALRSYVSYFFCIIGRYYLCERFLFSLFFFRFFCAHDTIHETISLDFVT